MMSTLTDDNMQAILDTHVAIVCFSLTRDEMFHLLSRLPYEIVPDQEVVEKIKSLFVVSDTKTGMHNETRLATIDHCKAILFPERAKG